MSKTIFKGLKLSEALNDQIVAAAEKRGMNWSEFVRHVLTNYFFNGQEKKEENDG